MTQTILAVDDNEIHCYALAKILQSAGFHVISARTGMQALAMVMEYRPHAMVLDVNLPDLNGYEICLQIRSNPETCAIPIIFHTASSPTGGARDRAESVGGTAFLTYPVDAEHLVTVVQGSLARNSIS